MTTNLTAEELAAANNCKTEKEWNDFCDNIKKSRSGAYPSDWFPKMILSGKIKEIASRWGDDGEMKLYSF